VTTLGYLPAVASRGGLRFLGIRRGRELRDALFLRHALNCAGVSEFVTTPARR
jgi:hypothetical protein